MIPRPISRLASVSVAASPEASPSGAPGRVGSLVGAVFLSSPATDKARKRPMAPPPTLRRAGAAAQSRQRARPALSPLPPRAARKPCERRTGCTARIVGRSPRSGAGSGSSAPHFPACGSLKPRAASRRRAEGACAARPPARPTNAPPRRGGGTRPASAGGAGDGASGRLPRDPAQRPQRAVPRSLKRRAASGPSAGARQSRAARRQSASGDENRARACGAGCGAGMYAS